MGTGQVAALPHTYCMCVSRPTQLSLKAAPVYFYSGLLLPQPFMFWSISSLLLTIRGWIKMFWKGIMEAIPGNNSP